MAVAEARHRVAAPAPHPWWRGRFGLVVAIAFGMLVAFLGWKNQLTWPAELVWNSLPGYLDRFQSWLSNNRNLSHPNVAFVIFSGSRTSSTTSSRG